MALSSAEALLYWALNELLLELNEIINMEILDEDNIQIMGTVGL